MITLAILSRPVRLKIDECRALRERFATLRRKIVKSKSRPKMLRDMRHLNVFPGEFEGDLDEIEFDDPLPLDYDRKSRKTRGRVSYLQRRLAAAQQQLAAREDERDEIIADDSTERNQILTDHVTALESEEDEGRREDCDFDQKNDGFQAAAFLY